MLSFEFWLKILTFRINFIQIRLCLWLTSEVSRYISRYIYITIVLFCNLNMKTLKCIFDMSVSTFLYCCTFQMICKAYYHSSCNVIITYTWCLENIQKQLELQVFFIMFFDYFDGLLIAYLLIFKNRLSYHWYDYQFNN